MKTILQLIALAISISCSGQNISFDDNNFKSALLEAGFDLDGDTEISESEALEVSKIVVARKEINSLKGIEYFKNVTWLDVQGNNLSSLDVREVENLQNFYLAKNQLSSLLVSGLQKLSGISAADNQLSAIDLSNLPNLVNLYIDNNPFESIDLSILPNLQRINISSTSIIEIDFSHNPKMYGITANNIELTELDLTGLCNLSKVSIRSTAIKNLDATPCARLKDILASRSKLEILKVKNGAAEELELDNIETLKEICVDPDEIDAVKQLVADLGYSGITINSNCETPILTTYYKDQDRDGYGDESTAEAVCILSATMVSIAGDCDDTDKTIYPGAPEICDEIDNNCDGNIDEGLAVSTYYEDQDGDGYGNDDTALSNCEAPSGMVSLPGDCDDQNPDINPAAEEIPNNGIDENCDGTDATTNVKDLSLSQINIFPNPANNILYIIPDKNHNEELDLRLYSYLGELVRSIKINSGVNKSSINLEKIPEGSYLLHLKTRQEEYYKNIIIIR